MVKKVLPLFILLIAAIFSLSTRSVFAADKEVPQIQCGQTENGQPIMVPQGQCCQCKNELSPAVKYLKEQLEKGSYLKAALGAFAATHGAALLRDIEVSYKQCSATEDPPKNCSLAPNGGGKTETTRKFLFIKLSQEDGQHCIVANFTAKYAYCYGCEVVETLSSAFIKAAQKAYDVSKQAGNSILIFGMVLWLAFFALKNVSSLTAVEPMKMLQDLMVQCFKVIVAFVILNSGIQTILNYTLVPIMNFGTEFANVFTNDIKIEPKPTISLDRQSSSVGGGGGASGTGQGGVR